MTPLHPDDARSARAWAAFAAEDAAAAAPLSLERRVLRAAKAALARKQQDDVERRRRRWFAGCSALAASLMAAAAWSLAPPGATPVAGPQPEVEPISGRPIGPASPAATPTVAAASTAPAAGAADEEPGPPLPMTNVEAGRVLATPPRRMLAARPLFDPIDGAAPVHAPGRMRAKSFGAPAIEPVFTNGRPAHTIAVTPAPALAAAPAPPRPVPPHETAPAPEVWSSRSFRGVFDPEAGEQPQPPPIRLDHAAPAPVPREGSPAPPE